jgi:hypothetical protein
MIIGAWEENKKGARQIAGHQLNIQFQPKL